MTAASEAHSIVIVDDVPEIREILGFLLEESGWFRVVGHAGTGEDAIAVVEAIRPDLLLLDLDLPGMSGWEVVPIVRDRSPDTAVVVLSGSIDDVRPIDPDVVGQASAVLEKGVSNRDLITSLLEVVGRSRFGPSTPAEPPGGTARSKTGDPSAWLDAVLAASVDAVIATTIDGRIISWNAGAGALYGYDAGEALGKPISMLVPADRPDELATLGSFVEQGKRVEAYETVRVHKDGSRLDVQLNMVPVVDRDGLVIGATSVSRNLTSRRQTEAALGRAMVQLEHRNRELMRSNEELDSFAAVASHDLAQPLQVAYGFLDMLRTDFGAELPERGQQWLDRSLESLERMRNLVRDILRYARSGSSEPKVEPVFLEEIVHEAIASVGAAIAERGAEVKVAAELPAVSGDRGQLALVLQNLIANAVKFVPASRTPIVNVEAQATEGEVVIKVSDNGVGIAPEQRAKVFEMFQRAAGATFAGTGLGLAIVKKIVGRHGGAVWIDDGLPHGEDASLGCGTTVAVRLPAA